MAHDCFEKKCEQVKLLLLNVKVNVISGCFVNDVSVVNHIIIASFNSDQYYRILNSGPQQFPPFTYAKCFERFTHAKSEEKADSGHNQLQHEQW